MRNIFILMLLLPIVVFAGESKKNVQITLNLESRNGELYSFLSIVNQTEDKLLISESAVGLLDFSNLLNRYVVRDKNEVNLNYIGIVDHSSDFVHCIPSGKSLDVVHVLSSVYNFEKINGPVSIQYKYQYSDENYKNVIFLSNIAIYTGPPLKFKSRESEFKL